MNGKLYDKALALINKGASPDKVYPLFLEAMDAGDYRAHYALGTWYLYGRHVKASNKKAVSLFRQAAENDVAEAAFDLAVCYEKGEGVRKDLSKAAAFYLRALRCGDESAAEELRRMFYWGFGVEKNRMIANEFAAFEKPGPEKPGRRWGLKGRRQVNMGYGSRDHVYWYDANNRLTNALDGPGGPSIIGLGYDVRGNVNNKNGNLFVFDHGNRLRTAQGTETYRYEGRRVRTAGSDGPLYEVYSLDGKLLWQRDEQIGMRYEYIYLNGSVVAIRRRPIGAETEDVFYWHNDALGSQIAATQGTEVAQTTEHEPYGRMPNRTNNNRIGYTGHVMDQATGLIYMQQRYYDPLIPRFLSVDPVTAYDSGDMRLFNRYAYAFNNPYKFTDPDGRCPFCNALNLKNQLVNAAEWISDKANAVSEKLDKCGRSALGWRCTGSRH